MSEEYAIQVKDVSKLYKLYDKPSYRIRDALGLTRKKLYREHYALHHMSFNVKKGETVGLIGTNGAGKSTILKVITGVLNPSEGEVVINGRISALLELGAGFNMEYTGIENIYLNGTMIGFSKEEIDRRMDSILKFADIGDFVYQPVKTYSSGMFVRLAFAVAINIDPEILIVDEALSVGDVFFQAKCYKKFEDFKKEGKTILFVSHDLGSISRYCDRVILLNKGVKLSEGKPKDMIDLYKKVLVHQVDEAAVQNGDADIHSTTGKRSLTGEGRIADNAGDGVREDGGAGTAADRSSVGRDHPSGNDGGKWMDHFQINPNVNEYGDGRANIIDYGIVDDQGQLTSTIIKGTRFTIRSKVQFNEEIQSPIFTYAFKNLQGVAITGTNTMYEKKDIGLAHKGDVYVASFEQEMNLQGGEYLLSISCTGYENGGFVVYHRLYDVINVTVISDKNTVGFYDMNSVTRVERVGGRPESVV
ncbi:ABC transporter ATP-binding protein [Bilifractor sp. HCP3S3_D3]|uniref:ABC transporter ATP-binding protein n=1 Tax=Bilifractor sp. HCP3S3_D3 TaxID=3438907 RepID=UPI003F8ABC9D